MRQLEEQLLYESANWFEQIEQNPKLSPIDMVRFYDHFKEVKRLGYDFKLQDHNTELNYITLVRYDDKSEIMSTWYNKNDKNYNRE